jgi:hypothetical protein
MNPEWSWNAAVTDEQLVAMTQQYTQTRQGVFICHLAFEEINAQVRKGRAWCKCIDCGNPYPYDREGASGEFCSEACEAKSLAYEYPYSPFVYSRGW